MICSKASLAAFFLLCSQASSFSPQVGGSSRAPSSLDYVSSKPAFTSLTTQGPSVTKEEQSQQARRRRRRNSKSSSTAAPKKYTLHSTRVSELTEASTFEDVITAIKRAQNLHSVHDVQVIGEFLLSGVDDHFAYGYKGSLLSRFAVAALRLEEYDIAREAMDARRERFASSLEPFESAAIVRGLLRLGRVDEAFEVIEDELSVIEDDGDRLKHRASALATVASRFFFENEPAVALRACRSLAELGPAVRGAGLQAEELDMPWFRILAGADQCQAAENGSDRGANNSYDHVVVGAMREFPLDAQVQKAFDGLMDNNEASDTSMELGKLRP